MGQLVVFVHRDSLLEQIHEIAVCETVIGRSPDCDLILNHYWVSRLHAMLIWRNGELRIRDLRSRNGTKMNGMSLTGEVAIALHTHIMIGPFALQAKTDIAGTTLTVDIDGSTCPIEPQMLPVGIDGSGDVRLTATQRRVLEFLLEGLIEKEVAAKMGIATSTVHGHVKAIYRAFSVSCRGELFAYIRNHAVAGL